MVSFDDISRQTHELVFVLTIFDLGILSFFWDGVSMLTAKKIVKTLQVFSDG